MPIIASSNAFITQDQLLRGLSAVYVGFDKGFRAGDGAVDVRLGGDVDQGVDVFLFEQPVGQVGVADAAF